MHGAWMSGVREARRIVDDHGVRYLYGCDVTPIPSTSTSSLSPLTCLLCRHTITTHDTHLHGTYIGPITDGRERYHVHEMCVAGAADVMRVTEWEEDVPTYTWYNVLEAVRRARHIKVRACLLLV